VAALYADAWMDERIPQLQYEACVQPELEAWRQGKPVAPYEALVRCFSHIGVQLPGALFGVRVLEVGASCGYNLEVMRLSGFDQIHYRALDFSPAYQRLAKRLWPDMPFDVGDARALPYEAGAFDIVLSGGVLLHVREYEQVIVETSRVASQFAIFHRTPVWNKETAWFLKEGYGIPMIEARFNEAELRGLFDEYGLPVIAAIDVAPAQDGVIHRSYLCKKGLFHHSV